MFNESLIVKRVPNAVVNRTKVNMNKYRMGLYDAFNEAVGAYGNKRSKYLSCAFLAGDYREYIPSAYLPEYLDFEKYPLYTL